MGHEDDLKDDDLTEEDGSLAEPREGEETEVDAHGGWGGASAPSS